MTRSNLGLEGLELNTQQLEDMIEKTKVIGYLAMKKRGRLLNSEATYDESFDSQATHDGSDSDSV